MKKLIALALVLGVATLANAGLKFQVNDVDVANGGVSTDLSPSLKLTLANTEAAYSVIDTSFFQVIGGASVVSIDQYAANLPGTWSIINIGLVDLGNGEAETFQFSYDVPAVAQVKAGALFDINVAVKDRATAYYYDSNGTQAYSFAIPEPITMALLALGGLFVRRK